MNIKLIFKYYWPHVKKYPKSGIATFISYGFALLLTDAIVPLLYKRIVDVISEAPDPSSVGGTLLSTVLLLGVAVFLYHTFFRIGDYTMAFSQSIIGKNIADDAFNRLQKHSYEFFTSRFTGSLVAKVKRYVDSFEVIHDQLVYAVWFDSIRLVAGIAILAWFAPILGVIFFVWLVSYIVLTYFFTKKKIKKDLLEAEANSKVTATLADAITNVLNIKMFSARKKELNIFAKATDLEQKRRKSALYFQNLQFTFQGYFIGIFEFVGMYVAVMLWMDGAISAGTIILMQIYIFKSFQIVWNMGRNFSRTMRAFAEAKEMVDIFEDPIAVEDSINPEKCKIDKGHIQIEGINFRYTGSGEVFKNLSIDINSGEKVGLVGPSGAGKTTITKLLLRFADLDKGRILIDGQNIARMRQDDLRAKIAYVPQEPLLFHRTIKENIAYGSKRATNEDIMRASKNAHAHKFIEKLPNGYNTMVGERGVKLSGGERQRVAIARAMVKDAPILILDEATSSLDSLSERHIQSAFDNLMQGRTTLVVAHRLSTIQKMDRIIVFKDGRIYEQGSHEELIAKQGLYYDLWKQQSHGFVGV